MALVVSGQVRHRNLQPDEVRAALEKHLPNLAVEAPDFAVVHTNSRVGFFCNTSCTLQFSVKATAGSLPAPAAVAILVRDTDILNSTLKSALSTRYHRAEVQYCLLEDEHSRSRLLSWVDEPPLRSRPARAAYAICLFLLVIGAVLVRGQLKQPSVSGRDFNVITLILSIGLPALTLPLPFLFEHLKAGGNGRWIFSHPTGGSGW